MTDNVRNISRPRGSVVHYIFDLILQPFLYQLWYFFFSVLGNWNYFFFAAHLLDVAVGVAALRIILEAITHNGKQLVLTVMLLTIVVYIYTVIAFNFFRKFYVTEEEEEVDQKCHDMFTVRRYIPASWPRIQPLIFSVFLVLRVPSVSRR